MPSIIEITGLATVIGSELAPPELVPVPVPEPEPEPEPELELEPDSESEPSDVSAFHVTAPSCVTAAT